MNTTTSLVFKLSGTALGIAAAAMLLVFVPAKKNRALRDELRRETRELLSSAELLQEFKDPAGELAVWEGKLRLLDQRFPTEQALGSVLQQLGDKANALGVEILSSAPVAEQGIAPAPNGGSVNHRQILLEMRCGYEAFGRFLAALPELPTFFSVEGMDLVPENGGAVLNAKLTLGLYVSKS